MEMRSFGQTGLTVSRVGIGLAALGRPGYINLGHAADLGGTYGVDAMQTQTNRVLDAAWAAGVRYFDAARSYGRAEEFLGNWLRARDIDPAAVTVGSKWGYTYTADWQVDADVHEVKEHSLPVLQRQWQETQERLGGYVDLYQIHSATFASGVLTNTAVLDALARLKSDGVRIGLSLSGPDQGAVLAAALDVTVDGVRLFDSVQATWNLLEPSAGRALAAAADAGLGIIVKEALANGRLTPRNDDPAFAPSLLLLQEEAARLATTVDALALAAVLAQPWAHVVLSGAATVEHLQSNVAACDVVWDELAATRLSVLAQPPAAYWHTRAGQPWN
ncbi:MAG: aldo/keto reductase [Caldilineaceae bacterium]|nr:aldo/keto reductase [Caldilineaceae bacterium]